MIVFSTCEISKRQKPISIVRVYHHIYEHACNGYIKPNRPGDSRDFFVTGNFSCKCAVRCKKNERKDNRGKKNMCDENEEI